MILYTRPRRILALILVLLSTQSFAGPKNDSLLHVYHTGKADANTLNDLIWVYVFSQPDSAIYFGNRAIEWCRDNGDDAVLATIHNRIGVAYDIRSTPDSALYHYNIALDQARKKENQATEAGALNNIGLIYWNKGETEKAIKYYIRSAEIFKQTDNQKGLASSYNNIALILFDDEQLEKSRSYNFNALKIRIAINDEYGTAASYSNIAQLYISEGMINLDSAIYYISRAIPLKQKINDQYGLARAYHNLGMVYSKLPQLDTALVYHSKALKIQLALENAEGYASTYYNIATVHYNKKDTRTQLAYLDSAETFARLHDDFPLLWKVFRSKALALGRSGLTEDAHRYWLQFDHLRDSIVNLERSQLVEELETRYRTAEKDREIAEQESELTKSELEIGNKNKWIATLFAGLLFVVLLGFALREVGKRKVQAEKDAAIIAEREHGLRAIISATENERKRIAKDLHDGIVQTLTGLGFRLQKQFSSLKTEDEKQQNEFSESRSILNNAIGEVREISHRMMPRVLAETGLIAAFEDMLEKSLGNTDIKYEFEHHKVEKERFAENVEISLYRICQELVTNIIKHAEAKAVSVQLLITNTHLVLMVEDNGKGFVLNEEKSRNGIGLMNITSRAKAMNGEVNYQAGPKHGTMTTIRVPLA